MRKLYPSCYRTILIITGIFLSSFDGFSQNNWRPEYYSGIPDKDRHTVIFDEFEDNRNKWNLESKYIDMRIDNGDYFYCNNRRDNPYPKRKSFVFNRTGDYEIEIRMRFVRGVSTSPMGLIFGGDSKGNIFNFYFTPQGEYKISQYFNYRSRDLKSWMHNKSIQQYSMNTLTVRKVGTEWYYFINRDLVYRTTAVPLFGSDFGFLVSGKTAAEIDYFKIQELQPMDKMGPVITLTSPRINDSHLTTYSSMLEIRGLVSDASGIKELRVNGRTMSLVRGESFYCRLDVDNYRDFTPVNIVASDIRNNTTEKIIYVKYKPVNYNESPPLASSPIYKKSPSINKAVNDGKPWMNSLGKNYLLLIGVNQYEHWGSLNNAVKDCQDISEVLTKEYQFDPEHVITLYNHKATRENILETLESLQDVIGVNDNLLIYYAGHGYYDEGSKLGYWVPVNARQEKIPDYIRNSTIHDYLKTIRSKHILLIADACYAGSLFVTRGGRLDENEKSRWAFTSGAIEKVWDGEPGQNSPFASYLINELKSNRDVKLYADDLMQKVKIKVERNTRQTPIGNPLSLVGDEGGIFVFYRKHY